MLIRLLNSKTRSRYATLRNEAPLKPRRGTKQGLALHWKRNCARRILTEGVNASTSTSNRRRLTKLRRITTRIGVTKILVSIVPLLQRLQPRVTLIGVGLASLTMMRY